LIGLAAIGFLLALLAGCGSSESSLEAVLDPTPTTAATATATTLPPTPGPPPRPTADVQPPWGKILKQIPLSLKTRGLWFGDRLGALEAAGAPTPGDSDQLRALSQDERDRYASAYAGVVLAPDLISQMRSELGEWIDVFGVDPFSVDLAVSTGATSIAPLGPVFLKGSFDETSISEKLTELGYAKSEAGGQTYFSIREDFQGDFRDPGSLLALNRMNRVFVSDDTIIAAPDTGSIGEYLELRAEDGIALSSDIGVSAVLGSLGVFLSAVVLDRQSFLEPEGEAPVAYAKPADWGTLKEWELFGMGYRNDEEGEHLSLSLYYPDAADAAADAGELVKRIKSYITGTPERYAGSPALVAGWPEKPFEEICGEIGSSIELPPDGSVLVVTCPLSGNLSWWSLVDFRDLGFLLP